MAGFGGSPRGMSPGSWCRVGGAIFVGKRAVTVVFPLIYGGGGNRCLRSWIELYV